eukprot:gene1811-1314_t
MMRKSPMGIWRHQPPKPSKSNAFVDDSGVSIYGRRRRTVTRSGAELSQCCPMQGFTVMVHVVLC